VEIKVGLPFGILIGLIPILRRKAFDRKSANRSRYLT
jgi:hypothetical protein